MRIACALAAAIILWGICAPVHAAPATLSTSAPATSPVKFTLNFKDVPLDNVLDYFSQTIGFEILKDGTVDARVTIMSKQPVSAEEAVTMLTAALRANGFTALREGRLLHIISRDKAKKGNVPVHFGNDPREIESTDALITQVVPIDNISAVKLADNLKALAPDADITSNEGSNTVIITDSSANVRRLVEIISQLDAHEATTSEVRIVQLKHADATATAKLLETLFKTPGSDQGQPQQGFFPRGMPQQQNQGAPPPATSERHGQTVVIAADQRTNSVLVMASTGMLKLVDDVLQRLDTARPNPAPSVNLKMFTLKYAAADATAKLINNLFKPASGNSLFELIYGAQPSEDQSNMAVTAEADVRSNTVIVTGPLDRLDEVDRVIQQLDTSPMVSQDLRVMHLRYADAGVVAKLVEDTFQPKEEQGEDNNSGFGIIFLSPAPPEEQVRKLKITVTSDERTNILMVSAPTALLDKIEKVVRELDADPATQDTMFIYHLRNGQAQHLATTLNIVFGNISSGQNQANPQVQQAQQLLQSLQGQNQQNDQSQSNDDFGDNANRNRPRPNQQGAGGLSPALNELTGKAYVVAETDTNALLVTTAAKYERAVRRIIDDLDQPVRQVLIKVLVAEVTHDNSDQIGVDFSVLNLRSHQTGSFGFTSTSNNVTSSSSGTAGQPQPTALAPGTSVPAGTIQTNVGQTVGSSLGAVAAAAQSPSGLVVGILESNLAATVQALESEGKLDVLSRPYILTSDNQAASIVVGEEDPFVTDTRVETTGQLVNTINYRQIGVILNVTPHVNPDGLVVMDVNPQVSQKQPGGVVITQGVISPVYSTRTASARVAIQDGATIVIGGMMQDQVNQTINKIPLLGDLPLLGPLFTNTSNEKVKTELLFFLSPHVAPFPYQLATMSKSEERGLKLVPHAVAPGVYDEHMKGMQRGELPQSQPSESQSPVKSIPLGEGPEQDAPQ